MSEFDITAVPLAVGDGVSNELDATRSALTIDVGGSNVTAFRAEDEDSSEHVELPTYFLAEWIAENWWALLWEPRKSEDSGPDSGDFLSRHSILSAQHGFLLPQVSFVSNGNHINISAQSRRVQNSDVHFFNRKSILVDRRDIESRLKSFLIGVINRLELAGIVGTHLQSCWNSIRNTTDEEKPYCEMIGALGLSPYVPMPGIDSVLDQISAILGETLTRDLCLVGKPEDLKSAARVAKLAVSTAHSSAETDITPLISIPVPSDNMSLQAWHRGVRAARAVREQLVISNDDASGANGLFDRLRVDPSPKPAIGDSDFQPEGASIVGAVLRSGNTARMSFIQRFEPQRRFAAARAIFSAWTGGPSAGHLLTQAVTRHQQASRAFAAEMLAPISLIKHRAVKSALSTDDIDEIAQDLGVGADVVYKQALNNGLSVFRAA